MTVLEAIKNRRSVRSYSAQPIPQEILARMRQALHWAPSACNIQPWHFVMISDPALRHQVATACREQLWIAQAPLIVVACGLVDQAYKRMGGYASSIDIDVAIAMDHLTLAAVEDGLGTCWIGAFNEQAVKDLLGVPANAKVMALTPLGYPAAPELIRPIDEAQRKPAAGIFSQDRWGTPLAGE